MARDNKIEAADWKRMRFKKNKVWLALEAGGDPVEKDGLVLIKYQLEQDYEYWVKKESVRPLDSPPQQDKPQKIARTQKQASAKKSHSARTGSSPEPAENTICIFTDGASSGNPGPSGIGVVLRFGTHEKEISKFIGTATNNIAELKAIEAGLLAVKSTDLPVRVYTDSNYAYGVLSLGWKNKKNTEIVESIKKTISRFKDLRFIKVKGHAGHEGNERADFLATRAIKKAQTKF
jgi:ribonuclease HI